MTRLEQLAEALKAARIDADRSIADAEACRMAHNDARLASDRAQDEYIKARGRLVQFAEELGSGREEK